VGVKDSVSKGLKLDLCGDPETN
jgi:hypothetical protein